MQKNPSTCKIALDTLTKDLAKKCNIGSAYEHQSV